MMNIKSSRNKGRRRAAFTLMELLIVISLIAVLAGMVMAAMPAIMGKVKRDQARLAVKEMTAGLSSYKLDNGWFPINPSDPVEGAFILYQHLSGDFDVDGNLDDVTSETKIYVPGIDWNTASQDSRQRVGEINGRYAVVDPFGSPFRYLCEPPGVRDSQRQTRNPTYDIWSLGGANANSNSIKDQANWITNWD
ncbi:MAG: prepilin-type N-terminal cleavage/methylation domain-containing protein [Verrucomicrobiales bacterium]|nr:prepilin-type N-terminal cleavage/methylation domain-containing protein [Verrucomicrobiales bacterium]